MLQELKSDVLFSIQDSFPAETVVRLRTDARCHAESGAHGSAGAAVSRSAWGTQGFVSRVPHLPVYPSESSAWAGPEVALRGWVADAHAGAGPLHGPSAIASLCPWTCLCCTKEQVKGERMEKRTKLSAWDHGICILWVSPLSYAIGKGQRAVSPPSALPGETHLCVFWLRMFL